MDAGNIIQHLGDSHPPWHHGDVGDEANVLHQPVALVPRIATEDPQFSFIGSETENGVERGGLTGAIGTDETEDSALVDPQVDPVQRDCRVESFAETACFYGCHGISAPSFRCSGMERGWRQRPVPSGSDQAARWWQRPWAILQ